MITPVSIKGGHPPKPGFVRLVTWNEVSMSVPPFEGAIFREARIFAEPGECTKMELLFLCEELPVIPDGEHPLYDFCRYNKMRMGVVGPDRRIPGDANWNPTYSCEVGWHWITVLCFPTEFTISAISGGHHDIISGREAMGSFLDYEQEAQEHGAPVVGEPVSLETSQP